MNIEKQVNSFHQHGFVKLPGLIDPQELKTLQADTQKIVDSPFEGIEDEIEMLADGAGLFTGAIGLELDLSKRGYGTRSARYAMIVKDSAVTHLNVEASGKLEVSDAATILDLL